MRLKARVYKIGAYHLRDSAVLDPFFGFKYQTKSANEKNSDRVRYQKPSTGCLPIGTITSVYGTYHAEKQVEISHYISYYIVKKYICIKITKTNKTMLKLHAYKI